MVMMQNIDPSEKILLSHGSGGKATQELIKNVIASIFNNPYLDELEDSSVLPLESIVNQHVNIPGHLVMTQDSYVVKPLFFPGGDIGKLSVCGTVNDLATAGAIPLALSVGLIIEEGFELETLEKILRSMKQTADSVGVSLITGDTKVVERGHGDGIYISTAGVGFVSKDVRLGKGLVKDGDLILINGPIGDHEACIMSARGDYSIGVDISSDCAPLSELVQAIIREVSDVRWMRDPTRGGVAAVLQELVDDSEFDALIDEESLPVRESTANLCEILGIDPIFMANEGKMIFVVSPGSAEKCISIMNRFEVGKGARIIGKIAKGKGRLIMETAYGTSRIVTLPSGSQLPRIC